MLSDDVDSSWYVPPFGYLRYVFQLFTYPRALRFIFSCQLALHLSLLSTSVALLIYRAEIRQLTANVYEPSAAISVLQQLPAWLLARSIISVALSARRLLIGTWRSSIWEEGWCVAAMWVSSAVMACTSLAALSTLQAQSLTYAALWAVVAVLLAELGAHLCLILCLCCFFPAAALTANMPIIPLAPRWYDDEAISSLNKAQKHDGLTPQQLLALPASTYIGDRDDAVCAVCMDDVQVGQVQRVLRCGHAYHQACIDVWLLKRRVCPLCVTAVRVAESGQSSEVECVVEMVEQQKPAASTVAQDMPLIL